MATKRRSRAAYFREYYKKNASKLRPYLNERYKKYYQEHREERLEVAKEIRTTTKALKIHGLDKNKLRISSYD